MTTQEIKRYFEAFPPPKQVQWKPWAKITDSELFLKSCYRAINNYKGPIERCPAFWHLKDFYLFIRENPQGAQNQNQAP
jgi:hypothetical protein